MEPMQPRAVRQARTLTATRVRRAKITGTSNPPSKSAHTRESQKDVKENCDIVVIGSILDGTMLVTT